MEVNINEDLEGLSEKIRKVVERSHQLMAAEIMGNLSEYAPVDQGKLQGSFDMRQPAPLFNQITSSAEYAIVVSKGSDPYEIYPKEQEALAFEWPGGPPDFLAKFKDTEENVVILGKVSHPGIEGTGYIDDAISDAADRADRFVQLAKREVGL